jgi:hypothetical protein
MGEPVTDPLSGFGNGDRFRRLVRRPWLAALLVAAALDPAAAQDVSMSWGESLKAAQSSSNYTFQFQYLQLIGPDWGGSLGWYNEGHLPWGRVDGPVLQGWRFLPSGEGGWRLGAGLGVYNFFRTVRAEGVPDYADHHGFEPLLSLSVQVPVSRDWALELRANQALGFSGDRTLAILGGVRVRLGAVQGEAPPAGSEAGGADELAAYSGRTLLNSFATEKTGPFGARDLAYRRCLGPHADVTLAYCDEGGIDGVNRAGVVAQGWITERGACNDLLVGFGLGPYVGRESVGPVSTRRTSLQYSMLAGLPLAAHWSGRVLWNRTLGQNQRDTDMFLGGLAYGF